MDYPYLVDTLKKNLEQISQLQMDTTNILNHITENAPVQKSRFIVTPSRANIKPLKQSSIGGKKTRKLRKK